MSFDLTKQEAVVMHHYETDEVIEIESCPECQKTHSYKLKVRRYLVPTYMSESDFGAKPILKQFTLTFPCPNTKKDFETSCTLEETPTEKAEDAKVIGLAD